MDSRINDSFNLEAGKVVSMREWSERTTEAYRDYFTPGERAFVNLVDKPVSIPLSIMAGSAMKGFFTDDKGETYISAEAAKKLAELTTRFSLLATFNGGRHFLKELNQRSALAFEYCEDHRQKVAAQQLKPR